MYDAILVRYGEIGLKGDNRGFFESLLIKNIRKAIENIEGANVYTASGRILVETADHDDEVLHRLSKVFGIVSMSPVIKMKADMEAFFHAAKQLLTDSGQVGTFRIDCKRADKRFPISSPEVCRELGGMVLEANPQLSVDLHHPDIDIHIEIRTGGALAYASVFNGLGGMPVACSGKGLLLLSGGLDSPVAGWMAMKRGIKVSSIHFYSFPYTGERSKKKVVDLAEKIAAYNQGEMRLLVINFTKIQETIMQECPEKYRVTILRRMMLRIAEQIAGKEEAKVIYTGESVGQVASQTIESLSVISQASSMLQLRPLAGMDKTDIIDRAHQIGTFELSILPFEDCCSLFVPKHPATKPNLGSVLKAEEGVDWESLIVEAVNTVELIQITAPIE